VAGAWYVPEELTESVKAWVRAGGTLIMAQSFGIYTAYGFPDGALMRAIFGDDVVAYEEGVFRWRGPEAGEGLECRYGRGRVLFAPHGLRVPPESPLRAKFYALLDRSAPRAAWCEPEGLKLLVREVESREPPMTSRLATRYGVRFDKSLGNVGSIPTGTTYRPDLYPHCVARKSGVGSEGKWRETA
jgi:hypothetical protein